MSVNIVSTFNDHLIEFFQDVSNIFPENTDIRTGKNSILTIKKMNPSIIIKIWKKYIANIYQTQIEAGDISFFIGKDYSNDLINSTNSDSILETINRLRDPIRLMNDSDQIKTMKYIKNLTKLSLMYN
jgi:hypothetical protein